MRKRLLVTGFLAAALVSQVARADNYVSDQAAALLVYPTVLSVPGLYDTVIQMSNTSTNLAAVQCYYVDTVGTCSVSGTACLPAFGQACPEATDLCIPTWVETDFRIYITGRQPLAWTASEGLTSSDLPLNGTSFVGPSGSNAGTRVPPFAGSDGIAIGELKCYVINGDGTPSDQNVLKGEATFVNTNDADAAKYSALGFRAIAGANNEDNQLVLGGDGAEYDGCPEVLILNHFFDFAENPADDSQEFGTILALVPCTQNFLTQVPTSVTAQYLVFNEFEQRFSTSAPVDCFFASPLSLIDTTDPERSIFSVFVSGTIAGQTRIRGVSGGLIGAALEFSSDTVSFTPSGGTDAFNLHYQGMRDTSDVVTVVQ